MDINILKRLGFSDKSAQAYITLLRIGPSSVRVLAENADLNRGSTYDALKWLQENGLVNFYHKDTKQFFVAENPEKLSKLIENNKQELTVTQKRLNEIIPEMKSLYDSGGETPVAKYYEGLKGLKHILEDVLDVTEADDKMYRIYSAVDIREYLYESFKNFSEERIKRKIKVKVIALGKGGSLRGLDERKWLDVDRKSQTYIIVYHGKTAYIALNAAKVPIGVVIENEGVAETQKIIFDQLWNALS